MSGEIESFEDRARELFSAATESMVRLGLTFRDTADVLAKSLTPLIVEWTKTPSGRRFMAKETKRIRYDRKMEKRHAREAEKRVPLSKTPEEAAVSMALYGVAQMNPRLLIDAANIRAKRQREALKNSGMTSLPVPEPPPVVVVVKPENLDREIDRAILGINTPTGAVSPEKENT